MTTTPKTPITTPQRLTVGSNATGPKNHALCDGPHVMNDSYNSRPATLRIPDPMRQLALVSDS